MIKSALKPDDFYFFRGGGEMGELIRQTNWSKTPLGDPEEWSPSLRTMVAVMLDNPFGMYIAWGKDFIQLYNDGYRPILGSAKHPGALGISTRETFSEIWHIIGSMFDDVMQGKAVGNSNFMLPLNRNGFTEECFFDFSYSPIREENGLVGGVLVTVIETTSKKKAEDALKESESRFRTMAEGSDILISVANSNLDTTYFNSAWERFTGRSVNKLLNFGWKDLMHPADYETFMQAYLASSEKKESFASEFRMMDKSGNYRWLLAKISARYTSEGSMAGYISSCIDITEKMEAGKLLRESEQETRAVIENAPFPIGVFKGREMRIEFANPAIIHLWGKGNEVIGKLFGNILPELDNQEIFKQLDEVYKSGTPFHISNQRLNLLIEGEMKPFYFNYSFTPLFNAAGDIYGVMSTGADVTDLNLAKQKIEQSEKNLRNMVLQAPVAMCIMLGPEHIVEVANELMIGLWGKAPEAVMNKPIFEGLPEARGQGLEQLLANVFYNGEAFKALERPVVLNRNGITETVYQNFTYEPYKDGNGRILGVLAISVNVTEQVLTRKKIEEAEEKARLAINSAELGVYEIDYTTDEMITDTRFKEIWGVDGSTSRKKYAAMIHPDDLSIRKRAHDISIQTGHLDYTTRLIWNDQSVHWVRVTGKIVYDDKSLPMKLTGIVQDITAAVIAQKKIEESEKNIRNMIIQAPVAMCILKGPSHIVEIANHKMIELWGKKAEQVINKPILEGLPEIHEQGIHELLDNVFATGERFVANELPVVLLRNGTMETVYVNFVYEALKKSDGAMFAILAVAIDVTQQVIARQKIEEVVAARTKELAEANSDLQKSNAELAQFAYIASHDLQEPLRKISTFSQMLEKNLEGRLDEQSVNYLNKINKASSRMNLLIRDVLTYSQLVKDNEIFATVNLNEILDLVKTDFELLIEQVDATVRAATLPIIDAIPLQMMQLFGNIIGNALKFIRKGTRPVINISWRKLEEDEVKNNLSIIPGHPYIQITFSDNGIGFKEEHAEKIFHIFQRLHRKSEYEGTGIGLSMCKKIAVNHYGDINSLGSSEQGAVFNVILPISQLKIESI